MRRTPEIAFAFLLLLFCAAPPLRAEPAPEPLLFLAGAASKPAVEELVAAWNAAGRHRVDVVFGGSGVLLTQLKLSGKGDIYFPGSIDFIEKARAEGLVAEDTAVVYLVPSICVPRGNPKGIRGMRDLLRKDLRVALAHPESVCLGVFGVEMAEALFTAEEKAAFRRNLVTYTSSCETTAMVIPLGTADAIVGWSVFEHWLPEKIESVKLDPSEYKRLSYLSAAVTTGSKQPEAARAFLRHMRSPEGLAHFKKFKYFTTPQEALEYAGADKPIGGEAYKVPPEWLEPVK